MKYLFVLMFGVSCSSIYHEPKNQDCNLIAKAIRSEMFIKRFYVCSKNEMNIINKTSSPLNCNRFLVCNATIRIVNDTALSENTVELYKYVRDKKHPEIYFHRPFTGATLFLRFEMKDGVYIISTHEEGAF